MDLFHVHGLPWRLTGVLGVPVSIHIAAPVEYVADMESLAYAL
jgi:hypothetical protein